MKERGMHTPEEHQSDLESKESGEEMGSVNMLPGEGPPSLEAMLKPRGISLHAEQQLVEVFAAISHEFRTPLGVISGSSSMLLRHQTQLLVEEQRELFQMIQGAGKRLEFLANRLLELAQLEAGFVELEYGTVAISSLADAAIAHAEQQVPEAIRDRVTFHLQYRDEVGNQTQLIPAVRGDGRCVRKVLDLLLENAIQFSPNGGRIDVIVRPVPPEAPDGYLDQPQRGLSFLEICVCDFGLGIPDEALESIFERFYRVDSRLTRQAYGLGLGLTICKYLVALHQGRIWAESCPDGGSAFHVWLPLAEPQVMI